MLALRASHVGPYGHQSIKTVEERCSSSQACTHKEKHHHFEKLRTPFRAYNNCDTLQRLVRYTALDDFKRPSLHPSSHYNYANMVYQGKPSAGCQNCRKRKIKVRPTRPPQQISTDIRRSSATNKHQHVVNASTLSASVPAMSPASTWSYGIRPRRFVARSSVRSWALLCSHHHQHQHRPKKQDPLRQHRP